MTGLEFIRLFHENVYLSVFLPRSIRDGWTKSIVSQLTLKTIDNICLSVFYVLQSDIEQLKRHIFFCSVYPDLLMALAPLP